MLTNTAAYAAFREIRDTRKPIHWGRDRRLRCTLSEKREREKLAARCCVCRFSCVRRSHGALYSWDCAVQRTGRTAGCTHTLGVARCDVTTSAHFGPRCDLSLRPTTPSVGTLTCTTPTTSASRRTRRYRRHSKRRTGTAPSAFFSNIFLRVARQYVPLHTREIGAATSQRLLPTAPI